MGCDFYVALARRDPDLPDQIQRLTDQQLAETAQAIALCDANGEEVSNPVEIREWLQCAANLVLGDCPADCDQRAIGSIDYLITGGPSYGDDPTGSYQQVAAVEYVQYLKPDLVVELIATIDAHNEAWEDGYSEEEYEDYEDSMLEVAHAAIAARPHLKKEN